MTNKALRSTGFAMLLAAMVAQQADVKAFQTNCNDFNVYGVVEGPDSVQAGIAVTFTGEVSTDPSGNGPGPVNYVLYYGDGSYDRGSSGSGYLSFSRSHTYSSSGPYTVTGSFTGKTYAGDIGGCDASFTINP